MIKRVLCYKTKEPIVYNKNYSSDRFLQFYLNATMKEAQAFADKLNSERPDKHFNGEPINWDKIDYFFISEQEEFTD